MRLLNSREIQILTKNNSRRLVASTAHADADAAHLMTMGRKVVHISEHAI